MANEEFSVHGEAAGKRIFEVKAYDVRYDELTDYEIDLPSMGSPRIMVGLMATFMIDFQPVIKTDTDECARAVDPRYLEQVEIRPNTEVLSLWVAVPNKTPYDHLSLRHNLLLAADTVMSKIQDLTGHGCMGSHHTSLSQLIQFYPGEVGVSND